MAVIMATTLTVVHAGVVPGILRQSLRNAAIAFPIALMAGLVIAPAVRWVIRRITEPSAPAPRPPTDRCA